MGFGQIYNTTWWGNALDTARTAGTEPDFFGSQMKLLTSNQTELVTNGDFATDSNWNTSPTSSILNGSANIISDGSFQYISQVNVVTTGKKYKIEYEITENNSGNLRMGFTFGISAIPSTVGVHSFEAIALMTTFLIERGTPCNIKLDNVSIKEVRLDLDQIEAKKCLADWIHVTALQDLNN